MYVDCGVLSDKYVVDKYYILGLANYRAFAVVIFLPHEKCLMFMNAVY